MLGETWMETGEAPDWQRTGRPARGMAAGHGPGAGSVPDRGRRRAEGPDRGRCLGLGPRAGKLARRSPRDRGRPGDPACWQQLTDLLGRTGACRRPELASRGSPSTPATRPARSMPGRAGRLRAGGAGEGRRGLQPDEPGDRADLCRRDRRGQAPAPRRAALDRGHLDLQGRDLSLPAAEAADGRRNGGRRGVPARHDPSAGLGGRRMAQAADRRAAGDGEATGAASRGSNGRSSASATRRWMPGSMPAPPPGSPGRSLGRGDDGPIWRQQVGIRRHGTGRAEGQTPAGRSTAHRTARAAHRCARAT
ncbi:MAG: hypothetical protein KatS3mg118_3369 [Paracoccaceae bacterium]|nr:MAG: hypothetical protein KatS3mg118_3369 [Paracoccaceae bacterium]